MRLTRPSPDAPLAMDEASLDELTGLRVDGGVVQAAHAALAMLEI